MMPTKLEECARAIYEEHSNKAFHRDQPWPPAEPYRSYMMNCARAVIRCLMGETTPDMKLAGTKAIVEEIESRLPKRQAVHDGQELTDEEAAQRYMSIGAVMRNSRETDAAFRAMLQSVLDEAGKE